MSALNWKEHACCRQIAQVVPRWWWSRYLTSLTFSFFIQKMGTVLPMLLLKRFWYSLDIGYACGKTATLLWKFQAQFLYLPTFKATSAPLKFFSDCLFRGKSIHSGMNCKPTRQAVWLHEKTVFCRSFWGIVMLGRRPGGRVKGEAAEARFEAVLASYCLCDLAQVSLLSLPQIPCLWDENNTVTFLIRLLQGLNKLAGVRQL